MTKTLNFFYCAIIMFCSFSVCLSNAVAGNLSFSDKEISHFQEQFTALETPPIEASSYTSKDEITKPLTGKNLEICLTLLKTAMAAPDTKLSSETQCAAQNQFQVANGVKAFQVTMPRTEKRTARAFLIFRDAIPVGGVLVADQRIASGREVSFDTNVQDIDQDGALELLRFEFRKAVADKESVNAVNTYTYFTWEKEHFIQKTLNETDPLVVKFVKIHRWRIFDEPPSLPDAVREEPDGYAIKLNSGKEIVLKNIKSEGDGVKGYGYLPSLVESRFFLFNVGFYESGQIIRVDRKNGEISVLPGPLVYSPSMMSFATASDGNDEWYSSDLCAFEIWRFFGEYVIKEYSQTCKEGELFYGPPVWVSRDELTYQKGFYTEDGIRRRNVKLVRKGAYWREELLPE